MINSRYFQAFRKTKKVPKLPKAPCTMKGYRLSKLIQDDPGEEKRNVYEGGGEGGEGGGQTVVSEKCL